MAGSDGQAAEVMKRRGPSLEDREVATISATEGEYEVKEMGDSYFISRELAHEGIVIPKEDVKEVIESLYKALD